MKYEIIMQRFKTFFNNKENRIIILIFSCALILRCLYLNYGLPKLYLEDEEFFVQPALQVARTSFADFDVRTLNPGWFGAPGQTLIYALAIVFKIIHLMLKIIQHKTILIGENYKQNMEIFQTAGRGIGALAGSLMVIAIWFVGKQWNRRAGIISAILVATSFYLVEHSHIIRPDIMQTLFILLCVGYVLKFFDDPKNTAYAILSGVFLGLAGTTKYPTIFILPGILIAAFLLWKKHQFRVKQWCAWFAASVLATLLSGPFIFIDAKKVIKNLAIENRAEHGGHDGLGFFGNLWWYISKTLDWEVGSFLYIIAIVSAGIIVVRFFSKKKNARDQKMFILFTVMVSYLLFLSKLSLHWERWVMPVAVFLFVFAGIGIDALLAYTKKGWVLSSILLLVIFSGPAIRLSRTMYKFSHEHVIDKSYAWIMNNIPDNSYFVRETNTPVLPQERYSSLRVPNISYYSLDYYRGVGVTHFLTSDKIYNAIRYETMLKNPKPNFVKALNTYHEMYENSTLIANIRPNPFYTENELLYSNDLSVLRTLRIDLLMGYAIHVYKLNPETQ